MLRKSFCFATRNLNFFCRSAFQLNVSRKANFVGEQIIMTNTRHKSNKSEIQDHFNCIDDYFKFYHENDIKNLEILKYRLFKLYQVSSKKKNSYHYDKSNSVLSSKDKQFLRKAFNIISEKTIQPFIHDFAESYLKFDKLILQILKNIYLFEANFPLEVYLNYNRLCDLCVQNFLANLKQNPNLNNSLISIITVNFYRLKVSNDKQSIETFEKLHQILKQNLRTSHIEAVILLNIYLKDYSLEKYILEIPIDYIDEMFSKNLFEKLCLILVRLNNSNSNNSLKSYIKNRLLEKETLEKLNDKCFSLLITTNFTHNILFSNDEIEIFFEFLKKLTKKINFLEIGLILTALHKGKALTREKYIFFAKELEIYFLEIQKFVNQGINEMNYTSITNILNVYANNIIEADLSLIINLFNDLNRVLFFHHLKRINESKLMSIIQADSMILRKLRNNCKISQNVRSNCLSIISKIFRKIFSMPIIAKINQYSFENLIMCFFALIHIDDEFNEPFIEALQKEMLSRLSDHQLFEKVRNKQILMMLAQFYEVMTLNDEKSHFEKKYLSEDLQLAIESQLKKRLGSFSQNYDDFLNFLVIISKNKVLIRKKIFFNQIEKLYIAKMKDYTVLENSYLAYPLVKFALFTRSELNLISEWFWVEINKNLESESLDLVIYNIISCFSQENQFEPLFFKKFEEMILNKILPNPKIRIDNKLKYFSLLGRYEIKNKSLMDAYEEYILSLDSEKIQLFEALSILNVILMNKSTNFKLIESILKNIENEITNVKYDSEFYERNLNLAEIISLNIKYEYPTINLTEFPELTEFSKKKMGKREKNRSNSHFQKNVRKVLLELKIDFEEEKIIGPFNIDFFILPNICLEINGKSHYINGNNHTKNTERKYRLLKAMDYEVKVVYHLEWNKFEKEENQAKKILEKLTQI